MTESDALAIARSYHDAWTGGDFDAAAALLAPDLEVEVPVNDYADGPSFAEAVRGFGSMVRRADLVSALGGGDEAMLLYDMEVDGLGGMRVAEHFTVAGGRIVRVRQVHDTADLRAAGFVTSDYRTELTIAAPAADVFAALADASGLRRWWSTEAEDERGGHMRLRWSVTDHLLIRVDRATEPSEIDWSFVAQRDRNLPRADEWVGTRATFRLAAARDGATRLAFVHYGLPPLDCGEICSRGWDGFLHGSLKPLLEGGAGRPWEPAR